jgi:hypothetical protein
MLDGIRYDFIFSLSNSFISRSSLSSFRKYHFLETELFTEPKYRTNFPYSTFSSVTKRTLSNSIFLFFLLVFLLSGRRNLIKKVPFFSSFLPDSAKKAYFLYCKYTGTILISNIRFIIFLPKIKGAQNQAQRPDEIFIPLTTQTQP